MKSMAEAGYFKNNDNKACAKEKASLGKLQT